MGCPLSSEHPNVETERKLLVAKRMEKLSVAAAGKLDGHVSPA